MKRTFACGAYPTMITPYNKDNTLDSGAILALTDWYWEMGCDGIFASCQSSEIHLMTVEERVLHAKLVKGEADRLAARDKSRAPMTVVASGHISDDPREQTAELNAVADTGVDALILISNRMDIPNTTDDAWIRDAETLLGTLPETLPLGVYECPRPYKRLLTEGILAWMIESGRFAFIKDTCCDAPEMARRCAQISAAAPKTDGYLPMLFNANGQTLLESLRNGASGYCGVMANFHPELYVWLCRNWKTQPDRAERLASFLSVAANLECLPYPCTAKYHLDKVGVYMNTLARTCDEARLTPYIKHCIDDLDRMADDFATEYGIR